MNTKRRGLDAADFLLLAGAVLPLLFGIVLKILTTGSSEDISITGAGIYFTIPMPLQDFPVTEALVNSWIVIVSVFFLCLFLTRGIQVKSDSVRHLLAEWIVEKTDSLVKSNMGDWFLTGFSPFVAAIMALSALSSLLTLIGLYPPTSDISIISGWAILVFILITYYKMKCGLLHYVKSFGDPFPLFAPMNLISEVATPVSMTFRHYGNVLSGSVISVLIGAGLAGASKLVLGWLPGVLGEFPLFRIGIPAVLSIYFDLFSGCLQAFIFAMLTMLYVAGGFPQEDYLERKRKRQASKALKAAK